MDRKLCVDGIDRLVLQSVMAVCVATEWSVLGFLSASLA
jgi:hypothetical protein